MKKNNFCNFCGSSKSVLIGESKFYGGSLSECQKCGKIKLDTISESHSKDIANNDYQTEIIALREQVFNLREEVRSLRNARLLGKIIKMREYIGGVIVPNLRTLPTKSLSLIKTGLLYYVSPENKKKLVKVKRDIKIRLWHVNQSHRHNKAIVRTVENARQAAGEPLVSIVVPFFNRAATIEDTLGSLKAQTYKNFEIIIVDDGSTDKQSTDLYGQLPSKYASLSTQLIRQSNQGVASARNNGIKSARGRYIICLDSDDMLAATYVEKVSLVLETNPDISVVTTLREDFGVMKTAYEIPDYDPKKLFRDNMVSTAAGFRKTAWERSGGYKTGIGYEDWDYWLTLAENGDWGKTIREPLFKYRVALQSRFVDDKDSHWDTIRTIRRLHPNYLRTIRKLVAVKNRQTQRISQDSALINLSDEAQYLQPNRPSILIAIPWMVFGGAETLIYNYCSELAKDFDITFITGLSSRHEWEYKFREITENIYHLPQLFDDTKLYEVFLKNYIATRGIKVLHIIHAGYLFDVLPSLKAQFPRLKIALTLFNNRVPEYVSGFEKNQANVDVLVTDTQAVAKYFGGMLAEPVATKVIPNGVDHLHIFNPALYDRQKIREELGLGAADKAVFFIGRLSEEKNPDVFIQMAQKVLADKSTPCRFFIVGDGPMRTDVEDCIYAQKDERLQYLGYQSDIAKFLAAADIFVLPSSIEGFPLSILEAMAMSVAVVASRVGAVPDVIHDGINGYTATPGDAEDFCRALKLLQDTELLNKIKTTNRHEVERMYSQERLVRNYKKMYLELLS